MPARRCPLVYRSGLGGRPSLAREVRDLIRKMSRSNATWGAPRIRNELAKLGIELSRATIAKYMIRHRKPPSPTWRAFLDNHLKDLVFIDFFVVPTATFRVLSSRCSSPPDRPGRARTSSG